MRPAALALALLFGGRSICHAQQSSPYTMHVYANLVQIPVLVLSEDRTPIAPVAASEFRVRLGHDKPFTPTHVRREGTDPLSLAILIDVSGDQDTLLPALADSIEAMAHTSLLEHDRVSIYAVDCQMLRTAVSLPADAAKLRAATALALASGLTHEAKSVHGCGPSLPLWNSMSRIVAELSSQPGRRVLLTISAGLDTGSVLMPDELRDRATGAGITLFGISATGNDVLEDFYRDSGSRTVFHPLCQSTGGIVLSADKATLSATLQSFISLVRGRYIMEFPRPPNLVKGRQPIEVTLRKTHAFLRSSGLSVPIADPVTPDARNLSPALAPSPAPEDPVPAPE